MAPSTSPKMLSRHLAAAAPRAMTQGGRYAALRAVRAFPEFGFVDGAGCVWKGHGGFIDRMRAISAQVTAEEVEEVLESPQLCEECKGKKVQQLQ
eukprot:5728408-Pyramimonas_sp.AAC.1